MPQVACKICKKEFYAKPVHIKMGRGVYCSNRCRHDGRKSGDMRACELCKKVTYKSGKQLSRSKSGLFFCSKSCQTRWRNTLFVGPRHANWKGGHHMYRASLMKSGRVRECVLCQTNDLRVLAVHHIDRNRKNNELSNLAWLCHNCHFMVHHDSVEKQKFAERLRE